MNKLLLLFVLFVSINTLKAQTRALTESGKQVVLYEDGTWKYLTDSTADDKSNSTIKLNPVKFSKSSSQSFVVKSNTVNTGVFIDPQKWIVSLRKDTQSDAEYRFALKSKNGMAMLISEKTPIGIENLGNIAFMNAQKVSTDTRLVKQEYRIVNGNKVLYAEMNATIQGIKFKYLGYYFSNANGTTQLLCYTSEALFNETSKELEKFLNGLVVI